MDALVRNATMDDGEDVFELVTSFATSYSPDRSAFDRALPAIVQRKDVSLLVAETQDGVAGYVLAVEQPTFFANAPVIEVLELFVAEGARDSGIGRRLLEEVTFNARQRGCAEVTAPTRRAAGFYEKVGFERTAEFFKRRL